MATEPPGQQRGGRQRPAGSGAAHVDLDLDVGTWVVEGGVLHRSYRVRVNDAWLDPSDVPGVIARIAGDEPGGDAAGPVALERPSGCQYLCRYSLRLPLGSLVERRVSRPARAPKGGEGDVLQWMGRRRPPRETVRQLLRVVAPHRLAPAPVARGGGPGAPGTGGA